MIRWETGRRVRETRRARGITQSTLADNLGISPNLLGAWERGDAVPSPAALDALIDALDVDPAEADIWVTSVVPTDIEIVSDPWVHVEDVAVDVARVPKITPNMAPPAELAQPPRPSGPMPPSRSATPVPPSGPAGPVPSAAPPSDPFSNGSPRPPANSNGNGNGNGSGNGSSGTYGGLINRDALVGKNRDEQDKARLGDFLRSGALSEAFDNLLKKDKGPDPKRLTEPIPKPPPRPVTKSLVTRPADPPAPPSNGNGNGNGMARPPAAPPIGNALPMPPSNGNAMPRPPGNAMPMPPSNGNGHAPMPPGSTVTEERPAPPRTRASAVVAEAERQQRIARKKAAEERALKRFIRKHGVTPAVYEQMKTSVNVGSAFPVPSTGHNPGTVRYSETSLEEAKKETWLYRARRIATIVALMVLALIGMWAVGELAKGWAAFLELFGDGEETETTLGALGMIRGWTPFF